ncbi:DNA-directed RNA polymerase specialized sigma24 family protein [Marmoricola sp. URHA0025 HA25]
MGVDESFAEYVSARWSMLYRLAVLLAGEAEADDLTQAGLVRAYLSWGEVQEAASADDRVKRILAATAVHEGSRPGPEDDPATSARGRLWATVSALPPRQRCVLVLRHYERLPDPEIAAAVGTSTSAVTTEAGALEAGIDIAALREELAWRAESAAVPLPPIDALVARGHQARRKRARRALRRAGMAAAVLLLGIALVAAVQSWTSGGGRSPNAAAATELPRFLSSLPQSSKPKTPYSVRRFLYLQGGRGVDLDERAAAIVQTGQWVYVAYLSGKIVRVNQRSLQLEPVVATSGGQLVTDRPGEQVAWLASASGPALVDLTALDPSALSTREQAFPASLRCCDNPFEVNGITGAGELIASLPAENRAWVWDTTGSSVREISGMGNGVVSQVTSRGLVVHYPPVQYSVGRLEDGAFLQVAELAARQADFSDPLGLRVVYADDSGEIDVRDLAARGRSRRATGNVRLRLPLLADGFAGVSWEDTNHVILDVYDESAPDGALIRCDVRDGTCEVADELEGPHVLGH